MPLQSWELKVPKQLSPPPAYLKIENSRKLLNIEQEQATWAVKGPFGHAEWVVGRGPMGVGGPHSRGMGLSKAASWGVLGPLEASCGLVGRPVAS